MNIFSHCRCALAGRVYLRESGSFMAKQMCTSSLSTHVGRPGTILGRVHSQEAVVGRLAPSTSCVVSTWFHTTSRRSDFEDIKKKSQSMYENLKKNPLIGNITKKSQSMFEDVKKTPLYENITKKPLAMYEDVKKKNPLIEDITTKTLVLVKEARSSPLPALTVGLAGLVPFMAAPAYMMGAHLYMPSVAFAQIAYGAAILSFNGGIRMGLTLPERAVVELNWFNLGYGAASTVVATLGLLLPMPLSAFTIMAGLGGIAYFDMAMHGYPAWYKGLRFVTAFIAILSLWTTLMCGLMLKRNKPTPTWDKGGDHV